MGIALAQIVSQYLGILVPALQHVAVEGSAAILVFKQLEQNINIDQARVEYLC